MASPFPQILPMWWILIFFSFVLVLFSLISFLSEEIFVPSRSYYSFPKSISSWLKF